MSIALWLAYVSYTSAFAQLLQRESANVRLAAALVGLSLSDVAHALPALDGLTSRALLGAVCFLAYAGCASVPQIHRIYADIVAAQIVPAGDAYDVVNVHSNSMAPTIEAGAVAIVDFSSYRGKNPQIGDVVAVMLRDREVYLKRIVARPGDAFAIDAGRVLTNGRTPPGWQRAWIPNYELTVADDTIAVDGLPLDRSIAYIPPPASWSDASRLPPDCYFVLGDNVNDSADSHIFGCVPRDAIIGKVTKVL